MMPGRNCSFNARAVASNSGRSWSSQVSNWHAISDDSGWPSHRSRKCLPRSEDDIASAVLRRIVFPADIEIPAFRQSPSPVCGTEYVSPALQRWVGTTQHSECRRHDRKNGDARANFVPSLRDSDSYITLTQHGGAGLRFFVPQAGLGRLCFLQSSLSTAFDAVILSERWRFCDRESKDP